MKRIILVGAIFVFGLTAAIALAGNGEGNKHHGHHHHCKKDSWCKPTTTTTTTETTTTSETTTTEELPPPVDHSIPTEDYCVQTAEAGETYVQANPGSFAPGGDWYDLVTSGATVTLDGHARTLEWEGGKGVILAAHVPDGSEQGYFATCGQPYVSTDGVYLDPSYGNR